MPSSRRARKHIKLGSYAESQRDIVAETPAKASKDYVDLAQRQRNIAQRAALADEFAALPRARVMSGATDSGRASECTARPRASSEVSGHCAWRRSHRRLRAQQPRARLPGPPVK